MRRQWNLIVALLALTLGVVSSAQALETGKQAPDFSGSGSDGHQYRLADYKGKYVVLEWYNRGCPFIRKHYDSQNMQMLQAKYGQKGVVWFEMLSSAPGKEGYLDAAAAEANRTKEGSKADVTLLDPDGNIGRLYGAKTTPHMYIIDPKGILIYQGAIDDHNSADAADIPNSKNYVSAALDEALAGKPVTTSSTKPYGCSVKYK